MALRVGIGYDIHAVVMGRRLVLGGVTFDTDWGLDGHSDADVLLHAVGDALLGAAGLGDLGTHFPPGEPRWKGISSVELLRLIRSMLDGANARIMNVDATLVARSPYIAPVRTAMCTNIGAALKLDGNAVSVKATSNEGIDGIGRGEGIAAWAVALVDMP